MLPLDDSYIHLQYARRLAGGHLLSYSPGMLPSGGMTSPLYVLLMSPLFVMGLEGVRAALGAFLFGVVTWMILPIWVHQLTRRLAGDTCAMIAALLVLANGHLLWNFMSGMETGLFTLLVVGAVLGAQAWWQSEDRRGRVMCLVCLAALPLIRPEGAVATIAVLMVVLARRGEHPRMGIPILLLCLLPLVAWLMLLKVSTGDWRPAGLIVKGVMANVYLDWPAKISLMSESLAAIPLRFYQNQVPDEAYAAFKGTSTMPYVPVGIFLLAVFGAGFALVNGWRSGKPVGGALLSLVWIGGLASVITSHIPFIHQQRYLAPWTVPAIILGVIGAWRISQVFHQFQDAALKAVAVGLIALSIPSLGYWMSEYGKNSRDIYHVLRVATFGVPAEGPPMAITDAGVLAFYTNRPVVDLVGLTSQEFPRPFMHGDGAVLARLSTLTHDTRPDTALTYREWFGPHFPFTNPRQLSSVPRTSITSGLAITKFDIDWELIDAAKPFPPDGRIIQQVNVAELESEAASRYTWKWGVHDADLREWPQPLAPVARFSIPPIIPPDTPTTVALTIPPIDAVDGGRAVRGESFVYTPHLDDRGGELTWSMRVGRPFLPNSPDPAATSIALVVESNTTGYRARRIVEIPTGDLAGTVSVDLSDLMDDAGGTAWKLHVEPHDPPGGAWVTYRHWITETNHQTE